MNRRVSFLHEMGLGPVWSLRVTQPAASVELPSSAVERHAQAPLADAERQPETSLPPFVDEDVSADIPPPFFDEIPWDAEPQDMHQSAVDTMDWEQLEVAIRKCTACGLCQRRTQAVPGVGDRDAAWLFVGEGPGFVEDKQGEPFVGPSGKLLDNMMSAMGLTRGANAYIANIVKCRPTDGNGRDRPPTFEEAAACRSFLDRQIALIRPEIIVALGKTAVMMLLDSDPQVSLAALRGKIHAYLAPDGRKIPLVATYHPAYLLRQLPDKKKAWADLCLALRSKSD